MLLLIREVAGWILVVLGLILIRAVLQYLDNRQVIEAGIAAFLCGLLIRTGIQLVRVATAARVALRGEEPAGKSSG